MPGTARRIRRVRYSASVRLVIDTDPGIDDALALLFAWRAPGVRVEAVTTVAGNVDLDTGTTNLLRLLALLPPSPAPAIAAGAAAPLARALHTATRYHGEDGLGDVGGWPPVDIATVPRTAIDVVLDAARGAGEDLTLVALGPLTNVALAIQKDRGAMRRLARVVAMGGAVDVPGNVTPTTEFNMSVDPEAAAIVLDAGLTLDVVPLDATRQAVLERERLETVVARAGHAIAARIARFSERGFRIDTDRGSQGMILHDPLAVGVALDPTLVTWEPVRLAIGSGGETRRTPGVPNCRIPRQVDRDRFLDVFLSALLGSPAP